MSQISQGELPYPEHRRVVDVEVILGGGGSGSAVDPWIWWFSKSFCVLYWFYIGGSSDSCYMSYLVHFCIVDEPMSWLGTCLLQVLGSDLTTEYVKINADYRSWWPTRVPQWWDLLSVATYCYATSLYDVSHRFFNCDIEINGFVREKNLHLNVQCAVQRLCLTILRGCLRSGVVKK